MRDIRSTGTHNTLDGKAPGTAFADVVFFTEAIPDNLRREIGETHNLYVCRWQRDLVIAVHKDCDPGDFVEHYRLVHPGVPLVTPHRGIYFLTSKILKTILVDEHRINAAFPPFRRGERWFRRRMWRRHTRIALKIMRRWIAKGYRVLAGGDLNTPHGVKGYQSLLHEVGGHFDRLGSTVQLWGVRVMSKLGSDHNRLRASLPRKHRG